MSQKKILIISFNTPFSLNNGGAVAQYFFLKKMVGIYDLTYLTVINRKEELIELENFQIKLPNLKIEIYKNYDDFIELKTTFKWRVINAIKNNLKLLLRRKKIKTEKSNINVVSYDKSFVFSDRGFAHFLNNIIVTNNYDCIQLEFYEALSLIPLIPDGIKKIFIHHEIRNRKISLYTDKDLFYKEYIVNSIRLIENLYLNLVDKIIVFNESDKNYLKNFNEKVVVSPFGIPDDFVVKEKVSELFNKIIFIGSENHYPNKEGLMIFLDNIYIPNFELISWSIHITGNWSNRFKLKYLKYPNIVFVGILDDFKSLFENAILLSPIISGSGIRTKILQGLRNRVPIIATKFSSEGLFDENSDINHIMFYESEMEFLDLVRKIKDNSINMNEIAINGYEFYLKNFDTNKLMNIRFDLY